MSTARLFIALWPDEATRMELARRRDAWAWPRSASPVKTERLHVTLHFLGDVARDRIPDLAAALSVPFESFSLAISRPVLWPHGMAVLEPDAVPIELNHLHERLGKALVGEGIALDARAYRPHVTLARRAGKTVPPSADAPVHWHIAGYRLMESTPGEGGGYTTLLQYP
jgi:2'-5' RNA ligase